MECKYKEVEGLELDKINFFEKIIDFIHQSVLEESEKDYSFISKMIPSSIVGNIMVNIMINLLFNFIVETKGNDSRDFIEFFLEGFKEKTLLAFDHIHKTPSKDISIN